MLWSLRGFNEIGLTGTTSLLNSCEKFTLNLNEWDNVSPDFRVCLIIDKS
jgi:hypothetical protein